MNINHIFSYMIFLYDTTTLRHYDTTTLRHHDTKGVSFKEQQPDTDSPEQAASANEKEPLGMSLAVRTDASHDYVTVVRLTRNSDRYYYYYYYYYYYHYYYYCHLWCASPRLTRNSTRTARCAARSSRGCTLGTGW